MKKTLFLILLFLTSEMVYVQEKDKFFPEVIDGGIIDEYVKNIICDEDEIKDEYIKILVFIDECINSFLENIDNYFTNKKLTRNYPIIKNGVLFIGEDSNVNYLWDKKLEKYKFIADIDIVTEFVNIVHYMYIYNLLVDYWYSNNKEFLSNYKDIDNEIINIQKLIKNYSEIYREN
jgi:hypothetical protein